MLDKYYIKPNEELKAYDIMKKGFVLLEDGTTRDEKVCTVYSMEYMDSILQTLKEEDARQ